MVSSAWQLPVHELITNADQILKLELFYNNNNNNNDRLTAFDPGQPG